jgi:hypothetical protein
MNMLPDPFLYDVPLEEAANECAIIRVDVESIVISAGAKFYRYQNLTSHKKTAVVS